MGITNGSLIRRSKTWAWKYRVDGEVRWESPKVSSKHDAEMVRQQRITEYHTDRSNFLNEELNPPISDLRDLYKDWAAPHLRPNSIESTLWALGHFERLSRCKTLGAATPEKIDRLEAKGWKVKWQDLLRDLGHLLEIELTVQDKGYVLRTETQGVAGKVAQACGVALPPTLRKA